MITNPRRRPLVAAALAGIATLAAALALPPAAQAQGDDRGAAAPPPAAASAPERITIEGERVRSAAGRQTLSGAELSRIPGASGDPMKAVQALPGVASVDDASGDPAVRGARPSDNLYYVDFLPVGYLFHLGGFVSVFHPDLIRRFDLATAAWSPEYGDAVGAIFDISLRNPRSDRLGGKIDFSFLGANVLFEGPLSDQLSFWFAARRSWFDLVVKDGEDKDEGVSYTIPVYHDSQGRALWTLNPNHRLRLDFSTAGDRIDFTLKPDSKAGQREPALVGNSNLRQSYRTLAATWDASLSPQTEHLLALGQTERRDYFRVGTAGEIDVRSTTTYLRQQLQWRPDAAWASTFGGSLNSRLIDLDLDFQDPRCTEFDPNCDLTSAPRVQSVQRTRQNLGDLYMNHRWRAASEITLTGGLRASRDQRVAETFIEPRLGLEWQAAVDTLFTLGYGRHNQAPPAEQALRDIGNPQLSNLRSRQAVVGLTHLPGGGWSWRAEVYAKTFDGYAVSDPTLNYRNGASGKAQGFELLVKKEGGAKLNGFFSLSVSRARRRNDLTGESFAFDFDQPVIANLVAQYRFNPRWTLGGRWAFHSGAPYTPVVGTSTYPDGRVRPVYGAINSQRLGPYHRLDLRLDAKFTPSFTAYFELINAYARKNLAGYSYSADYSQREEVYQLPLLPSVGLQYTF